MKRILVIFVVIMGLTACAHCEENKAVNKSPFAFVQGMLLGDDYVQYQANLAKIEESYKKGEISKEKYLELKSDADKDYKTPKQ